MNSLLKVYKHMGGRYQRQMSKMGGALLQDEKPIIDQTPGRLQYFKAENEPFVPGNIGSFLIRLCREREVGH